MENVYAAKCGAGKKACILMILFAVGSFVGWAAETTLFLFTHERFVDRGLLTLPFCPMYGLSMLLLYALIRTPETGFWHKWYKAAKTKAGKIAVSVLTALLYAACAALIATIVEYITGAFFFERFGVRLWNYVSYENNAGGFVCLGFSLMWGALAVTYMGLVWYPLMQLFARANTAVLAPVAFCLVGAIVGDFVFQLLYLHLHGHRFLPFA